MRKPEGENENRALVEGLIHRRDLRKNGEGAQQPSKVYGDGRVAAPRRGLVRSESLPQTYLSVIGGWGDE